MLFKSKPATIKKVIKLTHKNSETLSITIEGSNLNQVDYISKKKLKIHLIFRPKSRKISHKIWMNYGNNSKN